MEVQTRKRLLSFCHNSMFKKKMPSRGTTIIELLLYVSISSIILLALTMFLFVLLQSRVKNQTMAEVEQQGLEVAEVITSTLRNAKSITTPGAGSSSNTLVIEVDNGAHSPTIFGVSSGVLTMQEGSGSPIPLTNSRITLSNVQFFNFSQSGTPGIIRIRYTISHNQSSGRNEYIFSRDFETAVSVRQL